MSNPRPIEIFRVGRHTAMSGVTATFGETELSAIASSYDPKLHEAPIVVGHPAVDGPAYGWIGSLEAKGGRLLATPAQVDPQFAELVTAGRYKKISASFYAPDSPANPKPGSYYLRHVGFLGAQPPAVKGLRDASFAADEKGIVEFADATASLWRRLREWVISLQGVEVADKVVPEYELAALEQEPPAASPAPAESPAFAEAQAALEKRQSEQAARETDLAKREAELAGKLKAEETKRHRAEVANFVEQLVADGARVLPRDKAALVELLAAMPAQTIEFAEEGQAAPKKVASADWLKDFLKRLPKQVDFVERAAGGKGEQSAETVDPAEHVRAAQALMDSERKAGREISTADAVRRTAPKTS